MAIRVTLFNQFSVAAGATGALQRLRPRVQRLLAYLVLYRDRPLPREHVAFTLWPDEPERAALATLRRALNDLRTGLGSPGTDGPISATAGELRWNPTHLCQVDVVEFERLIEQGTPAALYDAVDRYAGELLADWGDEWVVPERERLHQMQLDALRQLAGHHRALGEFEAALALARRAVALDPFAESMHRDVMTLHAQRGDRAAALGAYERLRVLLRDELGVEPMPETESLRAAITSGVPLPSGERPAAPPHRQQAPPRPTLLVGRTDELRTLTDEWDAAASGRGRLAILSGEAGVGKSRLALALAEHAAGHGGLALTGHCYRLGQALPYQPISEMLRAATAPLRHVELAPAHRAALGRLAPDALDILGSPAIGASGAIDPRAQLFEALLQAFLALARGQPLLLVIEDMHVAADSTLDWLAYIAPWLSESRILVVVTHRTDETRADHALNRLHRRLEREGTITGLQLLPLSATATQELVVSLSHLTDEQAAPLATRLHRETSGNPFFLHELLRGLLESGQIDISDGRWEHASATGGALAELPLPETLRATIAARVQRLSETARSFLVAASVTGRVWRYEIVRAAGGWDEERALEALEELLARNFVHPTEAFGEFTFAHELVRDAVYADLAAPRRVFWHRRIADAFERAAERLPPAQQQLIAGRIAYHAIEGGRDALVFRWAPPAAEHHNRLYAYADALRMLEAASTAFERLRYEPEFDTTQEERQYQYIDILLRQSGLMPHVGRSIEEQLQVLRLAQELLARHPDERRQARVDLREADLLADQRHYEQAAQVAIRASERCRALDDRQGAALGLYQAGRSWSTIGRNSAAIEIFERSLDLYRSVDDAAGEAQCLSGIAWANLNLGRVEVAMRHLEHALALAERQADKAGIARACYSLAGAWVSYYNAERAMPLAERAAALYREIGFAWTAWRPQLFIAAGYMLQDDLARSEALLERVAEEARAIRDSWLEGWAAQLVGRLRLHHGDLPSAERWFESAYRLRLESGEALNQILDMVWLGRLRLAQGRPAAALEHTGQAIAQFESLGDEVYVWELPEVLFAHAQALAANGNCPGSRQYVQHAYDALMQFAAQMGDPAVRELYLSIHTNVRIITANTTGDLPA